MKRFTIILLCHLLIILTGCTYLGTTEDILISSPTDLSVGTIETFPETPITSPNNTTSSGIDQPPVSAPDLSNPEGTQTLLPTTTAPIAVRQLILSLNTKKIHYFDTCSYAKKIKDENRKVVSASDEDTLIEQGYTVCSYCAKHKEA